MRLLCAALVCAAFSAAAELPRGVALRDGAVLVGGKTLITHARRDVITNGTEVYIPAAERELFEHPGRFWADLEKTRFHDYAQKSTKVPVEAVRFTRAVSDGDVIEGTPRIRVVGTPGYTPGAVSYLFELGGKRIACTGDLIYGDGQIFDLYSLQDAVPEAKARGYHGYAARAEALIRSLKRVADARPDILVPSRGPVISNPDQAIAKLTDRLRRFLASHYETDALRWYWGDENHRIRSRAVERTLEVMPMAEQAKLPADILAIGNSRLLLSSSGAAFLVDAGFSRIVSELNRLASEGRFRTLDGIWVTHYHDDHTDRINDVVRQYRAPVYFTGKMKEVLQAPGSFRLPCLTNDAVPVTGAKGDGETLKWHEWTLRFLYFPGQTLYHGGLEAVHADGRRYFFVGDSFTPSGMDDYCMQNRVILRAGEGYDFCLRRMEGIPRETWFINQHVEPLFRFTAPQLTRMRDELRERTDILKEMSPWPDVNYMVDESWSRIHPYGSSLPSGQSLSLELRISNHAPKTTTYKVRWNVPESFELTGSTGSVSIGARQEGRVTATVRARVPGLHVITADITFDGRQLRQWTEALVRVEPPAR